MKKLEMAIAGVAIIALFAGIGAVAPAYSTATERIERKIIVFNDGVNDEERADVLRKVTLEPRAIKRLHRIIEADVVDVSASEEIRLKRDPRVKRIDDDVIVSTLSRDEEKTTRSQARNTVTAQAQSLPWGIDRIDAELVWPTGNTANPVKIGIIDTGISKDHPDLKANIKGGINTINSRRGWNDDNGHGSHVAGIVGALNNAAGVVGAAPDVDLYAIKVLGANGSGYLSDVIEGIQWAAANEMQVVNMSLGTSQDVQSLHDAVISAYNAGLVVVTAAGNSGGSVIFPAAYPEVIAVSATDSNNQIASWSSRGPEIDLAAPGVSIYSTYKGTGYKTLSGTSMASPHVAGSAALVLNTLIGVYDANANGKWDPAEVQKKLQDKSVDAGSAGFDTLYGWGLINAFGAVQ